MDSFVPDCDIGHFQTPTYALTAESQIGKDLLFVFAHFLALAKLVP